MCFYCKGRDMVQSVATHVVTLEERVIVIKNVPCEECEQCGEKYFSDEIMEQLEIILENAKQLANEVFVVDFANKVAC